MVVVTGLLLSPPGSASYSAQTFNPECKKKMVGLDYL